MVIDDQHAGRRTHTLHLHQFASQQADPVARNARIPNMTAYDILGLVLTGMLLGAMGYFSAVIAPVTFTTLDPETAGRFVRGMFPWYYIATGALAFAAAIPLVASRPVDGAIMAAVGIGSVISRQVLMPRINYYRDASLAGDPDAGRTFDRLHKFSVWINVAQILAAIAVVVRFFSA